MNSIKWLGATSILGIILIVILVRNSDVDLVKAFSDDFNRISGTNSATNTDRKCVEIINIMIADNVLQKYDRDCIALENTDNP